MTGIRACVRGRLRYTAADYLIGVRLRCVCALSDFALAFDTLGQAKGVPWIYLIRTLVSSLVYTRVCLGDFWSSLKHACAPLFLCHHT